MENKKDNALEVIEPKKELVLEGDPEKQLEFAMKAANALMKAVNHKPKKVMIRGEQYLEYGDWQTLARFFGATAAIEWTKPIHDEAKELVGYEARATVLHNGLMISSAEAMCMRVERNWRDRDEFMLRSMAQTRAAAKALRNAYGWVAELAGMKSTPAEEMDGVREPVRYEVKRTIVPDDDEAGSKQFMERGEIEEVQKEEIRSLLKELTEIPMPRSVIKLTGFKMEPENYGKIVEALRAKRDAADPMEKLDDVIE